ncbi:MAG TPA: fused MFS/spermidine synthase [Candidatus Binatus sp.]|nr:fused MFS/spermidine synthase [Candidatus Binatus sp.]
MATNPAKENEREDPASAARAPRAADSLPKAQRWLFATTIFLGAFLLFLIEPLFAKLILPWFGGSAAVWATCLVFFQTALLLGYFYTDTTTRCLTPKRQSAVHLGLLLVSLFWLPIAPEVFWRAHVQVDPAWRILGLLTFSIGLPFVLLSATSPLLQTWYARRVPGRSPYHLFALSNFASLLALLSFPFLIEPRLSSRQQSILWSSVYALFAICCSLSAWFSRSNARNTFALTQSPAATEENTSPSYRTKLLWLSLSACGSMMLLAVTNHLSENVAPVPLLWVLPLALYLLSFALVFAKRSFYSRWFVARLLAVALGCAGFAIYDSSITHAIQISVPLFCAALFVICFFCHGELVQRNPAVHYLTSFYLTIALGGALGAVCVGLLAPHILSGVYELPIVLLLAAILGSVVLWQEGWPARIFWLGMSGAMCAVLVWNVRTTREDTVAMMRNFYGALRIQDFKVGRALPYRSLVHGTIQHGAQYLTFPENRNPTTYYGRKSGVGLALRFCCDGPKRVGVIGLGAGTLAAYGKPGDSFRFYEVNPQVIEVANGWFTFLKQSPAKSEVILGDARISLESEPSQQFDVLAVDAFSGDAIPVHLITKEAFAVYFRQLKPGGILAVHTSNTYLNLAPVVKLLAEDADYATRFIASEEDPLMMISSADWVLVTRNQRFLSVPETFVGSENIVVPPRLRLWTDDYNNLFEILRSVSYSTRQAGGT